jgi:predicted GIY-YIG superfamily endonuclease
MRTKRSQLVCQHLESISRKALEEHQDIIRQYVRDRQGVYALYRRNKLHYVGLATNLRNRLKHHLRDRHGQSWDRFSIYLTIGDRHLRELEALILRTVKPAGNKQKGKFARSQDLRPQFRRDRKRRFLEEDDEIFGNVRATPARQPLLSKSQGRKPVLARFVSARMRLKARHKGELIWARVRRDGRIRLDGKLYTSPSLAAAAACKRMRNGWRFWKYERAPGDWVPLDTLRR